MNKSVAEIDKMKENKIHTLKTSRVISSSQCVLLFGMPIVCIPAYDSTDHIYP